MRERSRHAQNQRKGYLASWDTIPLAVFARKLSPTRKRASETCRNWHISRNSLSCSTSASQVDAFLNSLWRVAYVSARHLLGVFALSFRGVSAKHRKNASNHLPRLILERLRCGRPTSCVCVYARQCPISSKPLICAKSGNNIREEPFHIVERRNNSESGGRADASRLSRRNLVSSSPLRADCIFRTATLENATRRL